MRWIWRVLGVAIILAAWEIVHFVWGPFILPSLTETGRAITHIIGNGEATPAVLSTAQQALAGCLIGAVTGFALGVIGGYAAPIGETLSPFATVVLGVPPIVWVVLALLWFGPGSIEPGFTVVMTAFPIVFAATLQGVRSRDTNIDEMARVYGASKRLRMTDILLPQLAARCDGLAG